MSEDGGAKLTAMANQIARNLACEIDPAAAVADHIEAFWSPRMKDMFIAHGDAGLHPIARQALVLLSSGEGRRSMGLASLDLR